MLFILKKFWLNYILLICFGSGILIYLFDRTRCSCRTTTASSEVPRGPSGTDVGAKIHEMPTGGWNRSHTVDPQADKKLIQVTGNGFVKEKLAARNLTNDVTSGVGQSRRLMTSWCCFEERPKPRLGNMLFMYASLVGIAHHNNMTEVVLAGTPMTKIFKIKSLLTTDMDAVLNGSLEYTEKRRDRKCDEQLFKLDNRVNVKLNGFLVCWTYFKDVEDRVRESLKFQDSIQDEASAFLRDVTPPDWKTSNVTFVRVGIHVRRGDLVSESIRSMGYMVAPTDYYAHAMDYFRKMFRNVLFVVCSDDIPWAKEKLKSDRIVFSEKHSHLVDLAILASCNHTIMSVGTYGWWGAWLAGGQTVYYKNWPRPKSRLDEGTDKKSLFPPEWIPME